MDAGFLRDNDLPLPAAEDRITQRRRCQVSCHGARLLAGWQVVNNFLQDFCFLCKLLCLLYVMGARLATILGMDRNNALKQRIKRWVLAGFPQRKFADAMGKSESWVSRWLNSDDNGVERAPTLIEADKLDRYLGELQRILGVEEKPPDGGMKRSA
jgi:hypothetical protein